MEARFANFKLLDCFCWPHASFQLWLLNFGFLQSPIASNQRDRPETKLGDSIKIHFRRKLNFRLCSRIRHHKENHWSDAKTRKPIRCPINLLIRQIRQKRNRTEQLTSLSSSFHNKIYSQKHLFSFSSTWPSGTSHAFSTFLPVVSSLFLEKSRATRKR